MYIHQDCHDVSTTFILNRGFSAVPRYSDIQEELLPGAGARQVLPRSVQLGDLTPACTLSLSSDLEASPGMLSCPQLPKADVPPAHFASSFHSVLDFPFIVSSQERTPSPQLDCPLLPGSAHTMLPASCLSELDSVYTADEQIRPRCVCVYHS